MSNIQNENKVKDQIQIQPVDFENIEIKITPLNFTYSNESIILEIDISKYELKYSLFDALLEFEKLRYDHFDNPDDTIIPTIDKNENSENIYS